MTYTLVYLDHGYQYHQWIYTAFSQESAELIAISFCNRSGYTFADILLGAV